MVLETDVRLVRHGAGVYLNVRRMVAEGQNLDPDLIQRACGRLRHSHGVVAVPDPSARGVLIVASSRPVPSVELTDGSWQLRVRDLECPTYKLFARDQPELVASLVERALVAQVAGQPGFWSVNSFRIWYEPVPFRQEDDICAFRRYELSAIPIEGEGIGVVADVGTGFFSALALDHYFALELAESERKIREERFELLTERQQGQKGSLVYDFGRGKTLCYFEEAPPELTCGATGSLVIEGTSYESLHHYYSVKHPLLNVGRDARAVRVSFPNLGRPTPVAAHLLRTRVMNDNVPGRLSNVDKLTPADRRATLVKFWESLGERSLGPNMPGLLPGFWKPAPGKVSRFLPPAVRFGGSQYVAEPNAASVSEYKSYYRNRKQLIEAGHCYRFPSTAPRIVRLAHPFQHAAAANQLAEDLALTLSQWTKKQFESSLVPYENAGEAYARLKDYEDGLVLFVLNGEPAAYYEASFNLPGWRVKRVRESTLKEQYRQFCQGAWDRRAGKSVHELGRRRWNGFVDMNALELLQLFDAVPFRTENLGPFESQLVIDVGYDRRFFAVSLLVCRDPAKSPDFRIYTEVHHKADLKNETVNPVLLQNAIMELFGEAMERTSDPLESLLVLRDGRVVGKEIEGIDRAVNDLRQRRFLREDSTVDVVEFHKDSLKNFRLWEVRGSTISNPLEGTGVSLSRGTFVLCTTGETTLTQGTAEPVVLVHVKGEASLEDVAFSCFAGAQLNWSSPNVAQRLPLPLKRTDEELRNRSDQVIRRIR